MLQVYCLEVDTQGVYVEKQKTREVCCRETDKTRRYFVERQIRQGGILLRGRKDNEVYF